MTGRPSVSIVITSYNHRSFIEQALESALEQKNEGFDLDIVAVDDNSTDGTLEILQRLQGQYNFQLLSTKANSGPSAARNLGLKRIKSDWINFLDGDDYLLAGKVSAQLELLKATPEAAVCYSDSLIKRGRKITKNTLSQLWPPAKGKIYAHLLLRNCIALHSALVKSSVAKRHQFDESLWTAEDYDFWLRVARDGFSFIYLDQPLVVYRRSARSLSKPSTSVFDNTLAVLDKHQKMVKQKQEQENLNYHRSVILQNKADIYLRRFKLEGKELLTEASELGNLPRYKALSLKLMNHSFLLGSIFYRVLDNRSHWRAKLAARGR